MRALGFLADMAYIKVGRKERKKTTFIEQEFLCRCSHRFAHFIFPILPSWLEPNPIVQIRKWRCKVQGKACLRRSCLSVLGLGCEPRVENPKVLFLPLVVLFPPGLCKWYLLYYYSLIWGRTTMDKSQMRIVNGWLVTEWFMDLCLLTELWNEW